MIVIIDYGMGNLGSVKNMLSKVGKKCKISANKEDIQSADKLILPGVGAFDKAIERLNELDLIDTIKTQVTRNEVPILGICLGMQLLTNGSEEGLLPGLGLIDGYARKFRLDNPIDRLKVPHMGWNLVTPEKNSKLFSSESKEWRFYFVHSYAVQCTELGDVLTTTNYGIKFVSSFEKNNIIGVQYHPEKSHRFGVTLFKNFVENY